MGFTIEKFGDWSRAGVLLQSLSAKLVPAFKALITENGDMVLETMVRHIEAQDLNWVPLSESTVEQKGNDTIYVETGFLKNNLEVRKVTSSSTGLTLFIGASAWKKHPSGESLSTIMIWLEYGTDKIPARPLIRPTWEEVKPILESCWSGFLKEFIGKGGS
jgi:hypothetical protein